MVDQKFGRLAPVIARNSPSPSRSRRGRWPKQKAGGSSHRSRRVPKAATASVIITNRSRLRAVRRKQSGQRRRDSGWPLIRGENPRNAAMPASHPAKRRSAGRWGTRPALKIRPRQYQVVNQLHSAFVREVEMPRGQLPRKPRNTHIRGGERIGEGRRWCCAMYRPTAKCRHMSESPGSCEKKINK